MLKVSSLVHSESVLLNVVALPVLSHTKFKHLEEARTVLELHSIVFREWVSFAPYFSINNNVETILNMALYNERRLPV